MPVFFQIINQCKRKRSIHWRWMIMTRRCRKGGWVDVEGGIDWLPRSFIPSWNITWCFLYNFKETRLELACVPVLPWSEICHEAWVLSINSKAWADEWWRMFRNTWAKAQQAKAKRAETQWVEDDDDDEDAVDGWCCNAPMEGEGRDSSETHNLCHADELTINGDFLSRYIRG